MIGNLNALKTQTNSVIHKSNKINPPQHITENNKQTKNIWPLILKSAVSQPTV